MKDPDGGHLPDGRSALMPVTARLKYIAECEWGKRRCIASRGGNLADGNPKSCRMLDAYLRYYNEERPKEKLGWMSPMQYRRSLGLAA